MYDHKGPPQVDDINIHKWVCNYFQFDRDYDRRRVGTLLRHMRRWRNCADYDDVFPGDISAQARRTLADADELIRLLEKLAAS
jgi:hypothetical protein